MILTCDFMGPFASCGIDRRAVSARCESRRPPRGQFLPSTVSDHEGNNIRAAALNQAAPLRSASSALLPDELLAAPASAARAGRARWRSIPSRRYGQNEDANVRS
jgi:hypothetical protein